MEVTLILAIILTYPGAIAHYDTLSVSAYTNLSGAPPYNGLTASGQYTRPGIAACGPIYQFGTLFILPDGSLYICMDRGGKITDQHLDIWMPLDPDGSQTTALKYGRKTLTVLIIQFQTERRIEMPPSTFHGVIQHKGHWFTHFYYAGRTYTAGPFPGNAWGEIQAAIQHDKIVLKHNLPDEPLNFPTAQPEQPQTYNLPLNLLEQTND